MRVLICGDRNWQHVESIAWYVAQLPSGTIVVHGAAPGADTIAGNLAESLEMATMVFPAQWHLYGKAAGPVRNQQMLDEGKPDRVAYAHLDVSKSKGTADMTNRAFQAGLPIDDIWALWRLRVRD